MAALTLLEAAKQAPSALQRAVMMKYAESSALLRVLPFENITGTVKRWNREGSLPAGAFRAINASWTATVGVLDPQMEATVIAGGLLTVDRQLLKDAPDSRSTQELMKVKGLAHTVGHKLIKGDVSTTNTEFDGLQARCTGAQLLANGSTSGGDVLSLDKLDQLKDVVVRGTTHLVMSSAMARLLNKAIRGGVDAPITYPKDEFGRPVLQYGGIPILLTDGPGMVYSSLAFDEANPGGGSAVGSSIYAIRVAMDGYHGIQSGPMEVIPQDYAGSATLLQTLIEWRMGHVAETADCIGRLYGIKTGTPTV